MKIIEKIPGNEQMSDVVGIALRALDLQDYQYCPRRIHPVGGLTKKAFEMVARKIEVVQDWEVERTAVMQ